MKRKLFMPFYRFIKPSFLVLVMLAMLCSFSLNTSQPVLAASVTYTPTAKISFTFDDGYATALTQAAPALAPYGLTGTSYIITGCVGMVKVPNTCRADTGKTYMTWDQISQLQNTYGWEIGSHTVNHYCLASSGGDCQPNVLTPAQVNYELAQSKADLSAHGFNAVDMATPYGDYNNQVLAQIAKYYQTQRGFADVGNNNYPYSDYFVHIMQVQGKVTVAQVEKTIDQAITNHQWLILAMHTIKPKASKNNNNYEWSTASLSAVASYVKSKQDGGLIQPSNINKAVVTSGTNLLPNGSFNDGIADGWTTDSPAMITQDTATNGSFPDPTNSIKLVASATDSHLFSPSVSVDPNSTYVLKNFLNVEVNPGGEIAFYIDEYDANGNWLSGQYKAAERSSFVEEMNFAYTPTSAAVDRARLQVIITGGSGITAYLDNSQWFAVSTPTYTNLLTNSDFNDGIADGWHTDSISIVANDQGYGTDPTPLTSVELAAIANDSHLFSPLVSVDASTIYTVNGYLNIDKLTSGEVAFYIDEYDANGNWLSGQYKIGVSTLGVSNVSFGYQPSSVNVTSASVQVIVVGGSGIHGYIDNVQLLQPN